MNYARLSIPFLVGQKYCKHASWTNRKHITVIEAALETVQLSASAKQIQIQTVILSSAIQTLGDSARLQQIVWNLLSNAVKFTPTGGQIEVRLERLEPSSNPSEHFTLNHSTSGPFTQNSNDVQRDVQETRDANKLQNAQSYAQIQVKDTGKGINPDFLPYVFDYFRQEDGKTTRKFGGLGLGLAIVRHLTEIHGGAVQVESAGEGQGTTFTVRLPLISSAAEAREKIATIVPSIDLSQLKILVVDDDEDMRELVQIILQQQNIQVRVAASAAEALIIFDQPPPDVLISDIGMPEVNGYLLMQQIRNRLPKQGGLVPAIALTAYAGEYDRQQAIAAGFQIHLAKPVEPEKLIGTIVALLNP